MNLVIYNNSKSNITYLMLVVEVIRSLKEIRFL